MHRNASLIRKLEKHGVGKKASLCVVTTDEGIRSEYLVLNSISCNSHSVLLSLEDRVLRMGKVLSDTEERYKRNSTYSH